MPGSTWFAVCFGNFLSLDKGLNFVVATMLTHLNAEESFWLFVTLLKGRYELRSYFAAGVPELVVNLYCLDRFIEL